MADEFVLKLREKLMRSRMRAKELQRMPCGLICLVWLRSLSATELLKRAGLLIAPLVICACTTLAAVENGYPRHEIVVRVRSIAPVENLLIAYGNRSWAFTTPIAWGYSWSRTIAMQVPDEMLIRWKIDGKSYNVVVPLQLPKSTKIDTWRLLYHDDRLEVMREVVSDVPTPGHSVRQRSFDLVFVQKYCQDCGSGTKTKLTGPLHVERNVELAVHTGRERLSEK